MKKNIPEIDKDKLITHNLEDAYLDDEIIKIGGREYKLLIDKNGCKTLLRYNEEYKIWVILKFADKTEANSIISTLSRQYIERMTSHHSINE